jgi:hypothetical protein
MYGIAVSPKGCGHFPIAGSAKKITDAGNKSILAFFIISKQTSNIPFGLGS